MEPNRSSAFATISGLFAILATSACGTPPRPKSPPPATVTSNAHAAAPTRTGRIPVRGVTYYYEVRGRGEPLLLLHGGLGSIDMFGPVLDELAQTRQVIAIDLHGHGRTPLGDRKIDIIDMGNDLSTLLDQLGYPQVDALGYSMGAGVAFRLAVQHPEKVRRLALVSACFSDEGFHPEMRPQQAQLSGAMADMMKDTPMYKSYAAVAPNPAEFPKLLDQMGEWMKGHYDWKDDVKKIKAPVLLVYGDSDMFRPEHEVEFYKLLGGGLKDAGWNREHMSRSRLAILPDVTHYDIFMSPALVPTVRPFLDGKRAQASWAAQVDEK